MDEVDVPAIFPRDILGMTFIESRQIGESSVLRFDFSAFRQIYALLVRHPRILTGLVAASLLAVLTEALGVGLILPFIQDPQAGSRIFETVPGLGDLGRIAGDVSLVNRIRIVTLILVGMVFVRGVVLFAVNLLSARLQIRVERGLQQRVFRQLHEVELHYVQGRKIGNMVILFGAYAFQSGRIVLSVARSMGHFFTVAMYAAFLLLISWPLTLIAVALATGVMVFIGKGFHDRISRAGESAKEHMKTIRSIGIESLSGMKTIHLFSQEEHSIANFERALEAYHRAFYKGRRLAGMVQPLFRLLSVMAMCFLLISSTVLLPGQTERWVGQLVLFVLIVFRLIPPAATFSEMQTEITRCYPALRSILDFCESTKPQIESGSIRFHALQTGISFENVTFRYNPGEENVLKNLNCKIPKGKISAIVGQSGSGKSTLVNLLSRLYDCSSGRISVDGIDLRDLDIRDWRRRIAVVSQDAFIFNDTVLGNLRFGKDSATEEEIFRAARIAQAHDFITALPQGYQTILGDRGVRLSGGQQQRIAIARAILIDPELLILDEANSELDSETELKIQNALDEFGLNRTVLVIAHRLSTVRQAANIMVLAEGKVVEQGRHAELIRRHGPYWRLAQAQESKS